MKTDDEIKTHLTEKTGNYYDHPDGYCCIENIGNNTFTTIDHVTLRQHHTNIDGAIEFLHDFGYLNPK